MYVVVGVVGVARTSVERTYFEGVGGVTGGRRHYPWLKQRVYIGDPK